MVGWNKMVRVVVNPYRRGRLYIIDDRDRDVPLPVVAGRTVKTPHQKKVDLIYSLFTDHTNFEIISVRFPPNSTPAAWTAYWKRELNRQSADSLVFIYFDGKAGGLDQEYKLSVSQSSWLILPSGSR